MKIVDSPRLLFLLLIYLLVPHWSCATDRSTTCGAREMALAQATVALPTPFALFQNQALLTEQKSPWAAIGYSQPFGIPGYHKNGLVMGGPVYGAVLGLGCSQSALATYHETSMAIAVSKSLSGSLSAGILINYFDMNFPETGQHRGAFQVDGGILLKFSERWSLGLHFRNMMQSRLETFQYALKFPLRISSGFSCRLTDQLLLVGESNYDPQEGTSFCGGFEYLLLKSFALRSGVSTNSLQPSFGFGYAKWRFQIDYAVVYHAVLGFTQYFSINFTRKP